MTLNKIAGYNRHFISALYTTENRAHASVQTRAVESAVNKLVKQMDEHFKTTRWVMEQLVITPQTEDTNIIVIVGRKIKRD